MANEQKPLYSGQSEIANGALSLWPLYWSPIYAFRSYLLDSIQFNTFIFSLSLGFDFCQGFFRKLRLQKKSEKPLWCYFSFKSFLFKSCKASPVRQAPLPKSSGSEKFWKFSNVLKQWKSNKLSSKISKFSDTLTSVTKLQTELFSRLGKISLQDFFALKSVRSEIDVKILNRRTWKKNKEFKLGFWRKKNSKEE